MKTSSFFTPMTRLADIPFCRFLHLTGTMNGHRRHSKEIRNRPLHNQDSSTDCGGRQRIGVSLPAANLGISRGTGSQAVWKSTRPSESGGTTDATRLENHS